MNDVMTEDDNVFVSMVISEMANLVPRAAGFHKAFGLSAILLVTFNTKVSPAPHKISL